MVHVVTFRLTHGDLLYWTGEKWSRRSNEAWMGTREEADERADHLRSKMMLKEKCAVMEVVT